MLTGRIRKRCPSAAALGMAELHGHELPWHKRSRDGSGNCDVVQSSNGTAAVYGVLYEIFVVEKLALHKAEGLGNGYAAKNAEVAFKDAPRMASIYHATVVDPSLKPYTWYKAFVVAGAKEHNLPGKYIDRLVATDAIEDPDRERHRRNWQLLAADGSGPQL
jgi:gamma-glutamylcyclotransferase